MMTRRSTQRNTHEHTHHHLLLSLLPSWIFFLGKKGNNDAFEGYDRRERQLGVGNFT